MFFTEVFAEHKYLKRFKKNYIKPRKNYLSRRFCFSCKGSSQLKPPKDLPRLQFSINQYLNVTYIYIPDTSINKVNSRQKCYLKMVHVNADQCFSNGMKFEKSIDIWFPWYVILDFCWCQHKFSNVKLSFLLVVVS